MQEVSAETKDAVAAIKWCQQASGSSKQHGCSKQEVAASKRFKQVRGKSKHAFASMKQWQQVSDDSMQAVAVSKH